MDVLHSRETGDKYRLEIPGLPYAVELPLVVVGGCGCAGGVRIASLNLVGQIRLNQDLGRLLARRIQEKVGTLEGVVFVCVVEKALQLAQTTAEALGVEEMAVAYNRVKPHMEAGVRPVIQMAVESVTSGGKFLAMYERDMRLLATATRGLVIIDDVVSSGGTLLGLCDLLEEVMRQLEQPMPPVLGVFCAATEGVPAVTLPAPIHALATLPAPVPNP
ncbi:MAG: adenine phosphoribosyltransferase [Desulfovibrio sp.]|nr:adenine phosphoribosyltransferase [Desulfovibrio sp.]MCA1985854.1 adenine phosphoribosyltransferase [Desulfovibrio sp.]